MTRPHVRSGDVTEHEAVLWARGDRPGRLTARLSSGAHVGHVLRGLRVDEATDFTGRLDLTGLTAGRAYEAAIWFEAPDGSRGEVAHLCFCTAPSSRRSGSLVWFGAGAGAVSGTGARSYAAAHRTNPDLVLDLGPSVDPLAEPVAQSVEDFRARHRAAGELEQLRELRADVPFVSIWDDHETHRRWLPGTELDDERYAEVRADVLASRARRAWHEHQPMRAADVRRRGADGFASDRIYRRIARGPLVDLLCLDLRVADGVALLGTEQAGWLVREASRSTAVWKLLAADVGPAELMLAEAVDPELERVLRGLRDHEVDGLLWLCAGDRPGPSVQGEGVAREVVVGPVATGFGHAALAADGVMTASVRDAEGVVVWRADLSPAGRLTHSSR